MRASGGGGGEGGGVEREEAGRVGYQREAVMRHLRHLSCRAEGEDERWLDRLCRFYMAGEAVFLLLVRILADRFRTSEVQAALLYDV